MCGCTQRTFSDITNIKVVGQPIGNRGRTAARGTNVMIDADNDGKCQEENGKWVPCPPGVGTGSVVDGAGKVVRAVAEAAPETSKNSTDKLLADNRKKAAAKAERITAEAERAVSENSLSLANDVRDLMDELENADPRDARRIRREIKENIEEIFSHKFTGLDNKQYEVELEEVSFPESGKIFISGKFVDKNGRSVGNFKRELDLYNGSAYHEIMIISEGSQGIGIGTAFNARNEILYRELGLNHIVVASLSSPGSGGGTKYNGATHWPKNGYDWADEKAKFDFMSTLRSAMRQHEQTVNPDGSSTSFASKEEYSRFKKLYDLAQAQTLSDKDRVTAGDLLNWSGAELFFQKAYSQIDYRRDI